MFSTEDVISTYQLLEAEGIRVWLTGGWGVDALLKEQTRPHKDLDIIMLVDDVTRLRDLMAHEGYTLKELWSENRWTVDTCGAETATAFVLRDPHGREIDAHAMRLDAGGNGLPAWGAEGFVFAKHDFAEGAVVGHVVRCFTPENQIACHTGYDLPEAQVQDLARLHAGFGVTYPEPVPMMLSTLSVVTPTGKFQTAITATLSVRDWARAIDFYTAAFGAQELFRVEGGGVAQLAVSSAEFWVAEESVANLNFSPESLGGCSVRMLLIVEDPAAICAQAIEAGAREVVPVADEHGWRLGRIADPFGHHWEVGKPLR